MRRSSHRSSLHRLMRIALTVGALTVGLLITPSAAVAHGKHGHGYGKKHSSVYKPYWYGHGKYYGGKHYAPRRGHHRFVPPRAIHKRHVKKYKPYYYGRSYYRPHGHHHTIYSFPVYYDPYGYPYPKPVYYPYAYCESSFFAQGVFTPHGPQFSFGFSIVK